MPFTKKAARFFETDTAEHEIPSKSLRHMREETHEQYRGKVGGFAKGGMRHSMAALHKKARGR